MDLAELRWTVDMFGIISLNPPSADQVGEAQEKGMVTLLRLMGQGAIKSHQETHEPKVIPHFLAHCSHPISHSLFLPGFHLPHRGQLGAWRDNLALYFSI